MRVFASSTSLISAARIAKAVASTEVGGIKTLSAWYNTEQVAHGKFENACCRGLTVCCRQMPFSGDRHSFTCHLHTPPSRAKSRSHRHGGLDPMFFPLPTNSWLFQVALSSLGYLKALLKAVITSYSSDYCNVQHRPRIHHLGHGSDHLSVRWDFCLIRIP